MKTNLIYVEKNTFMNKNGEEISYCKFTILEAVEKSENKIGFEASNYTCSIDYFPKITEIYLKGTPVQVEYEFKKQRDNTYKKKVVKLGDLELI